MVFSSASSGTPTLTRTIPQGYRASLSRERNRARLTERLREPSQHRQVGVKLNLCLPVIPLKGEKGPQIVMPIIEGATRFNPRIQRHTQRFRDLYAGRQAVEREYGRLKHDYGLAPLRVRGIDRVALHADLTMLARLAQALSRTRAVALAA